MKTNYMPTSSPCEEKSTNDVSTAYSVSFPSVSKSQNEGSASYTDKVIHSFLENQLSSPQLDCDDLEQINDDDLEEMDLKWQMAMISINIKKDCRAKWNQDSKRRDGGYNGNKARENKRRPASQDDSKALVTIDGESVFINKECDLENTPVNDRYAKGMHAVPPPMTGNYKPSGPDVEIDYSQFTYGPKQTSTDESDSKSVEFTSSDSDSSVETTTSMPAPVDNTPMIVCEPNVWTDAPIIEEYESDSDDVSVSNVQENIEKPSFAFIDSVKHEKSPRENVKEDPHKALKDKGIVDSGCSRHMTGNKAHLADYQEFKGGFVAFGGSNGKITGKGKIKTGRSDNGTEFKNHDFIEFYGLKGIKRQYSNAKTPQQNGVAERKNKTLIEDTRTMLADSFLPTTFWVEAVNTACYVLNRNQANKSAGPQEANNSAGTQANYDQGTNSEEINLHDEHFVLPIWSAYTLSGAQRASFKRPMITRHEATHEIQDVNTKSTNLLNAISAPVSDVGPLRALNDDGPSYPDDPSMPHLEDIYASPSAGIFTNLSYENKDLPFGKKAIGTKWVYRNKKDKRGVIVRNKARLVAQGHRQEEGIDYDEVFTPVARIEAIRIFLDFASNMGFIVYQMGVNSAFLYGTIDEEVYVTQPPGFVDPKFPNKVYKVMKALYGLHQAPRAWYATLSTFLEKSGNRKGAIDKTLFIKQDKKDIMLIQVL
nr:putative ribonuclease H-like domain-containing protein [Tanacetum cinerariifolium]